MIQICQDSEGRGIHWDSAAQWFVIDGIRATPDFLTALVNHEGPRAVQFTREGDVIRLRSVEIPPPKETWYLQTVQTPDISSSHASQIETTATTPA